MTDFLIVELPIFQTVLIRADSWVNLVTRAGVLPEVVGDAGVYARSNQTEDLAEAITEALRRQEELGPAARRRIAENFPLALRRQKLHALIEELLTPGSAN